MSWLTTSLGMATGQKIEASLAKLWGEFDQIYCISLKQRTDRRERALREFERVGLTGQVQFVLVEKHPTDSQQGIFDSHMSCLRTGLAAGAERILIFEDDVLFRRFTPQALRDALHFMKNHADWHLFFFGCFVKSSRKTPFRSVLRVKYRCTAHAYVVRRKFAEQLVEVPWRGMDYDDLLRSMDEGQCYVCYPAFAFQSDSSSDNNKTLVIDRLRRLMGGVRHLQRWDEFSKHNLVGLVIGHVAFVLLVVLIWLAHTGRR